MKRIQMRACHHIDIVTPKKYHLNGLWFGPKKARKVIIFIHGLTGSAFSMSRVVDAVIDASTALITFNNRGFEQVGEIKREHRGKSEWVRAGAGHEVFTECLDDIQGAVNFAKKTGVKAIYLAGHSTGCQKAFYWASKTRDKRVRGIILFGPLSDYASAATEDRRGKLKKSIAYARRLVHAGKPHELMPANLGPWFVCDAQRFLSLYTPDSVEEMFTYAQLKKNPRILKGVRTPTLVLLAGADEHADRPTKKIAMWFEKHMKMQHKIAIVPRVKHSFRGAEKSVAGIIRHWIKAN